MPKVRITRGDEVLMGFVLGDKPVTLGRGHEADIHIPDKRLSRQHCKMEISGGRVVVTDLGSTNGIYHKGDKVPAATLEDEDEFLMGEVAVQVQTERLKLGTTEFTIPGEETLAAAAGPDETGSFQFPLKFGEAGAAGDGGPRAPTEIPKGLVECARRLEALVDKLSVVYDDIARAIGRDEKHADLVRRLRDVTIEAEALVGD